VLIACFIGLPLGMLLALVRFPGRSVFVVFFHALMGLPPLVAGFAVDLAAS
jgi:tungstate transport system permease protein